MLAAGRCVRGAVRVRTRVARRWKADGAGNADEAPPVKTDAASDADARKEESDVKDMQEVKEAASGEAEGEGERDGPRALEAVRQGGELMDVKPVDRNEGKPWWRRQHWNTVHSPEGQKFRDMTSLGRFPYENSYFGPAYERSEHDVLVYRGNARDFPMPDPMERRGRHGTITWEGKVVNAALEMYYTGRVIYIWYLAGAAGLVWIVNYMSVVDTVPLPESIAALDTLGTGTSLMAKVMLPDFKCFDAGSTDRDKYMKLYTAAAFSCWGFWPYRKFAGITKREYYARAYHLHFRRKVEEGEYFADYLLVGRERTEALLKSDLWGTYAHVKADVDDDGVVTMQLSTILPEDHWSQRWRGSFVGDSIVTPVASFANRLLTRHWMTSSCNFFLRYNLSEVYVKPLQAAQIQSSLDVFA
eukprot:TRINITY_DN6969_c0_g2_i1.p1 TRINITY_DN6969_c0_g2~~TRINITY_DN6969_c0_g2_i1.p1  ORF type:complete len:415 (+),score=113.64 TRINITY_DN6969_c0_g2_i1:809-2053(+)